MVIGLLGLFLLNVALNAIYFPTVKRQSVKRPRDADQPRVSVLVPARNEAHQIALCLESLTSQTYRNLEVIVLDDCSEDDTAGVAKELGLREDGKGKFQLIRGQAMPRGWAATRATARAPPSPGSSSSAPSARSTRTRWGCHTS